MKQKFKVGDITKALFAVSLDNTYSIIQYHIIGLIKKIVKNIKGKNIYILRTKKIKDCSYFLAKESSLKKATKEETQKLKGDIVLEEL